ncbi:Uroporphyrinogen-III methyltransferase [Pseudomonas amygdali pv. eriobotryae]|uniref:Uroporphyrinogen-III methyltransferase n=1 Tax=Pseudomonas amygdali pv. eriobotryae TaxID=129137 RepID=A0A0P9QZL0_PSEA0|nr:Uroporphyrinogen-III methyltransferase [Pseudomonas amygdali pv. eriobotryae]
MYVRANALCASRAAIRASLAVAVKRRSGCRNAASRWNWSTGSRRGSVGATQCGISLTLRGMSRGVTLVTAHTQDDSSLNWQALAQGGTTLVVYMGVAKLAEIRESLQAGGMSGEMPVAMIENASLPWQRECRSTLNAMQRDASAFELKSPAILVIGAVAACSNELLNETLIDHAQLSAG